MRRFPEVPPLNLGQQLTGLKVAYPNGDGTITRRVLQWDGELTPTPISRTYRVDVEMRQGQPPKVFVRTPCLLDIAEGRRIPHLYQQKPAELCLYRPGYGQWTPSESLARTIIPWAGLWLYYFEDWMIHGEWRGGGEHPL